MAELESVVDTQFITLEMTEETLSVNDKIDWENINWDIYLNGLE